MIIIVYSGVGTTARVMKENVNKLNGIDATHMIEDCLKDENGIITQEFLEINEKKNTCELCGICEIGIEFKVEDIESGKEWNFNYNSFGQGASQAWEWFKDKIAFWDSESHLHALKKIIITIHMDTGKVHIGRLHVWS
jgi:hypothetical protein